MRRRSAEKFRDGTPAFCSTSAREHCGAKSVLKSARGGWAETARFTARGPVMSSRPGGSHTQALPEPSVSLSTHTAPDVWLVPCHSRQLAKRIGVARRTRASHSRAPFLSSRCRLTPGLELTMRSLPSSPDLARVNRRPIETSVDELATRP